MKILRELIMLLKNPILVTALFASCYSTDNENIGYDTANKRFDIKMLITAGGTSSHLSDGNIYCNCYR